LFLKTKNLKREVKNGKSKTGSQKREVKNGKSKPASQKRKVKTGKSKPGKSKPVSQNPEIRNENQNSGIKNRKRDSRLNYKPI